MNRLRKWLAALRLAAPAYCQDAASIIAKVAERNKSLDGYRVEGNVEVFTTANNVNAVSGAKFLIEAAEKGRKLHIEYDRPDLALAFTTDGSTIWTYAPREKAFTKVEASTVTQESDDEDAEEGTSQNDNIAVSAYSLAVGRYANLDKTASLPHVTGEDSIKTAEGKIRCWILEAKISGRIEKIWVDQRRFLVLRSQTIMAEAHRTTQIKISIKRFDLEPPKASAFTFVPDKHAKLVDELNLPGAQPVFVGRPAADFELKNLEGEPVRLSDLRGKIVVLDFWATWCPPCRHELPTVNKLSEQLKDKGVVFLGINDEGAGTVKSFNKKYSYTLMTLEDANDKVHHAYKAHAIPSVFVIGRDGIIVKHFIGTREEGEFMAALKSAGLP